MMKKCNEVKLYSIIQIYQKLEKNNLTNSELENTAEMKVYMFL